jgi:hypothetical protein
MKKSDHFQKNIRDAELNLAMAEADRITDAVWATDRDNYDHGGVIFSLFVNCIHYLTLIGWTERELINEVFEHSEEPMEDD